MTSTIGGTTIGKSVFPADTPDTIAAHFAYYINALFVGVWAEASSGVLTITVRSPAPDYSFSFSESHTSAGGTVSVSGSLTGGVMGDWVIDDAVTPVLNRAARDWHAGYFAELAANDMACVVAFSQELVLPHGGNVPQRHPVVGAAQALQHQITRDVEPGEPADALVYHNRTWHRLGEHSQLG